MNIEWKPVINYSSGRAGFKPEAIVIHIAEGTLVGGFSWFNNASSQVSSHYMLGKNGAIWQFVKNEDTAWHAGGVNQPNWPLLKPGVNPNLYTIGIEHEGFTGETFTEAMQKSLVELIHSLCKQYNIPVDRNHIIGHNQINSVSRSRCPGTGVNLDNLVTLVKNYIAPIMEKELREQIARISAELSSVKSSLNLEKQKTEALNVENQTLKAQIVELSNSSDKLATLQKQNSLLVKEVATLQASQTNLNNKVKDLETENKKLKDDAKKSGSPVIDFFRRLFK